MPDAIVTLKAISDQLRARVVLLLQEDEACVCELMEVFAMSQSRLSHHLLMLKKAGFLKNERRGKWNYYSGNMNGTNNDLFRFLLESLKHDPHARKDKELLRQVKKKLRHTC